MTQFKDLHAAVFPAGLSKLLTSWRLVLHDAARAIKAQRPADFEELVQINGCVMTDSFERDVAARVGRSRGL
jgi:hypothetical protein